MEMVFEAGWDRVKEIKRKKEVMRSKAREDEERKKLIYDLL